MSRKYWLSIPLALVLSAVAVSQDGWDQMVFEQFGDRYGKVIAMCRDRLDNLYLFANRLNADSNGYEPVVIVKEKGGCWQVPQFILGSEGEQVRSARIVTSPHDNSVHILFNEANFPQYGLDFYVASLTATGWNVQKPETTSIVRYYGDDDPQFDLAVDSLGRLHAVWARLAPIPGHWVRNQIVYAHGFYDNLIQTVVVDPREGVLVFNPRISVTPQGRAVIVYQRRLLDVPPPTRRLFTMVQDSVGSAGWRVDSLDLFGSSNWYDSEPEDLAVDRSGNVHLIFSGMSNPIELELFWLYHVTRELTDRTWTGSELITSYGIDPLLQLDSLLRPHVVYRHMWGYTPSWYLFYATYFGAGWAVDTLVAGHYPGNWPDEFAFVLDSQDYPHVVYTGQGVLYTYGHVVDHALTMGDAVFLLNYIFGGGDEPCEGTGYDVDCSSYLDISDVVRMIEYIWEGGDLPCKTN